MRATLTTTRATLTTTTRAATSTPAHLRKDLEDVRVELLHVFAQHHLQHRREGAAGATPRWQRKKAAHTK